MRIAEFNYGPIQMGQSYKIMSEGHDYYKTSRDGKPVTVPKWVFDVTNYKRPRKEQESYFDREQW